MNTAENIIMTGARIVDITPFLRRFRELDQAAIDAENARADKVDALLAATRKLTYLVKIAKRSHGDLPRPPETSALIVKALRAQLGIVRELDALRQKQYSQ